MAIKIRAAAYGTLKKGNDVTEIVQALVNNGNDDIRVTNDTMGGDPAPGDTKRFGVVYELDDGTVMARAFTEGNTVDLVPSE